MRNPSEIIDGKNNTSFASTYLEISNNKKKFQDTLIISISTMLSMFYVGQRTYVIFVFRSLDGIKVPFCLFPLFVLVKLFPTCFSFAHSLRRSFLTCCFTYANLLPLVSTLSFLYFNNTYSSDL